jgi:integrase
MDRPPAKLLDRVRYRIRVRGYSIRTEQSYVSWRRRFILFHNKRHPQDMGKSEIEAYLTYLAVARHVSPSTQNQAFNALLFLYRNVLEIEFPENRNANRSKRPVRLPTVLTKEETMKVISMMTGFHQLMVKILYGSGLRAIECLRFRNRFSQSHRGVCRSRFSGEQVLRFHIINEWIRSEGVNKGTTFILTFET